MTAEGLKKWMENPFAFQDDEYDEEEIKGDFEKENDSN